MENQNTPIIPIDWNDRIIENINHNFSVLMGRITNINDTITNLDLIHIQQVYSPIDIPSIDDFMTNCWVKLPVYGGVYCNYTDAGYSFIFNDKKIKNGDYLVKMPNNEFIHVPGDTPNCYKPISYNNGILGFALVSTTNAIASSIEVPQWAQGSNVGHIAHDIFEANTVVDIENFNDSHESSILNGRYFINNEEIIFPRDTIDIKYSIRPNKARLTFPTPITEYYIPYYDEAS